jgi:hypothetical protein
LFWTSLFSLFLLNHSLSNDFFSYNLLGFSCQLIFVQVLIEKLVFTFQFQFLIFHRDLITRQREIRALRVHWFCIAKTNPISKKVI